MANLNPYQESVSAQADAPRIYVPTANTAMWDAISKKTGQWVDEQAAKLGEAAGVDAQNNAADPTKIVKPLGSDILSTLQGLTPGGAAFQKGANQQFSVTKQLDLQNTTSQLQQQFANDPTGFNNAFKDARQKWLDDPSIAPDYKMQYAALADHTQVQTAQQITANLAHTQVQQKLSDLETNNQTIATKVSNGILNGTMSQDEIAHQLSLQHENIASGINMGIVNPLQAKALLEKAGFEVTKAEYLKAFQANPSLGFINDVKSAKEHLTFHGTPLTPEQRERIVSAMDAQFNQNQSRAAIGSAMQRATDNELFKSDLAQRTAGGGPLMQMDPQGKPVLDTSGQPVPVFSPAKMVQFQPNPTLRAVYENQMKLATQTATASDVLRTSNRGDDETLIALAQSFKPQPNQPDFAGQQQTFQQVSKAVNATIADWNQTRAKSLVGQSDADISLRQQGGPGLTYTDEMGVKVPVMNEQTVRQKMFPGDDTAADKYLARQKLASEVGTTKTEISTGLHNAPEIANMIDQVAGKMGGIDSAERENALHVLAEAATKKAEAFQKDATGEILRRDPTGQIAQQRTDDNPVIREQGYAAADALHDQLGTPLALRTVTTKEEREQIGSAFKVLPAQKAPEYITGLAERFGSRWPQAWKELVNQDEKFRVPNNYQVLASVPDHNSQVIVSQALGMPQKEMSEALIPYGTDWERHKVVQSVGINTDLSSMIATLRAQGLNSQADALLDTTAQVAGFIKLTQPGQSDPVSAAVKLTTGHYTFTSDPQVKVRIDTTQPNAPQPEQVESYGRSMLDQVRPEQIYLNPRQPGETKTDYERQQDRLQSARDLGRLINGPDGTARWVYPDGTAMLLRNPSETGGTPGPNNSYSTTLSPAKEKAYQEWVQKNNIEETPDYDMRGFFASGDKQAENGHFSDKFKRPNHPTFSDESIYHGQGNNEGGHWAGDTKGNWTFTPGLTNLHNGIESTRSYLKMNDPDVTLREPNASDAKVVIAERVARGKHPNPDMPSGFAPLQFNLGDASRIKTIPRFPFILTGPMP